MLGLAVAWLIGWSWLVDLGWLTLVGFFVFLVP